MSNLESAKASIHSELEQARLGAEHYAKRVASLEDMLRQLSAFEGTSTSSEAPKKRGRKPGSKVAQPAKAKRARPAKAKASSVEGEVAAPGKTKPSGKKSLPSTKGSFWKDQVTTEPKSWSDILDGAIANLNISPSAEQRKKLQSRMIFSVNALVKAGDIKDTGTGRDRRFFI